LAEQKVDRKDYLIKMHLKTGIEDLKYNELAKDGP
jgi:hypothetical protein